MNKPWEIMENPVRKLTQNDKIKVQLHLFGIDPQPKVRIAMFKTAFKCTGKYDKAIRQFEAMPANKQTFKAFCTFIILEYFRYHKHRLSSAKSAGYGIDHNVQTKSEEERAAEDTVWAIAEIVQNVQAVHNKQIETYMAKMYEMLRKLITAVGNNNKNNGQNGGPNHGYQCPHCKRHHPDLSDNKCWELWANAAQCPANWVLVKDHPMKAT